MMMMIKDVQGFHDSWLTADLDNDKYDILIDNKEDDALCNDQRQIYKEK